MRLTSTFAIFVATSIAALGCVAAPSGEQGAKGKIERTDDTPKEVVRLDPDLETLKVKILEAHNEVRRDAKLSSLSFSAKLQSAAEKHAIDMAKNKKMSHTGSDGSTSIERIKSAGYPYRRAGENVAFGYLTTDAVMSGWLESPDHKHNILGAFSQIGVGCAIAEDGKRYWCVTFGLPMRP